jgi:hypothetical protein
MVAESKHEIITLYIIITTRNVLTTCNFQYTLKPYNIIIIFVFVVCIIVQNKNTGKIGFTARVNNDKVKSYCTNIPKSVTFP